MRAILFTSAALAAALSSQAAYAQQSSTVSLEEVVVTAERRETNLQRTAVAVQAVSGDSLAKAGVTQTENLTKLVPGLQVGQAGPVTQIFLRGVGSFVANSFAEPAIAFNLDGVYIARQAGQNATFFDIDRVEVVKGPQGTLYGRNATGGALNVITRKPTDKFGGEIGVNIGSYNHVQVSGAANIPLTDDLAMRAAFQSVRHDGYSDDGFDDEDTNGARLTVAYRPSDRLSLMGTVDYAKVGGIGPGGTLSPYVNDPRAGGASAAVNAVRASRGLRAVKASDAGLDETFFGVTGNLEYDLGFTQLSVIAAYRTPDIFYKIWNPGFYLTVDEESQQRSVEVRLSHEYDRFRYVAGVYAYREDIDVSQFVDQTLSFAIQGNPNVDTDSWALFGQATFDVTDKLRLTGGLRYTEEQKSTDGFQTLSFNLVPAVPAFIRPAACPAPGVYNAAAVTCTSPVLGSISFDKVNYKVGLEYDVTDTSLLYANVSTGFKSGGFYASLAPNSYLPEELEAYAVGSKNRFFDNRVQLNAEAFYWKYTDQHQSHTGPVRPAGVGFITENVGQSDIYGIDLDGQFAITANDSAYLRLLYLDAEYKDFKYTQNLQAGAPTTTCKVSPAAVAGNVVVDCSGRQMIRSPEWSMTAGYSHTFDLGDAGKLVPEINVHYETSSFIAIDFLPGQRQDAYHTTDLALTYEAPRDRWTATAYVNNVEDEDVINTSSLIPFSGGLTNVQLKPPRTYGVRVNAKF